VPDLQCDRLESPIGPLTLIADSEALVEVLFDRDMPRTHDLPATARLKAYFDGDFSALDEIAIAPRGTGFQWRVWSAVREVRAGETASYAEIAAKLGSPKATRAVGAANGANPIVIVVPCHRIIGSNGKLTGYGGGLDRKRWLLAHEARSPRS